MLKVNLRLLRQRLAYLLDAPVRPRLAAKVAERIQKLVVIGVDEGRRRGSRLRHDDVDVLADLTAEGVEREVVDVVAEGVFDFAAWSFRLVFICMLGDGVERKKEGKGAKEQQRDLPMSAMPRMMYAAKHDAGIVIQPKLLYNWNGRRRI